MDTHFQLSCFKGEFEVVNVDQTVNLYMLQGKRPEHCMSALMPRVKLHRIACDCFDCQPSAPAFADASESVAAARQDPPPKCLVIYTDPIRTSPEAGTSAASTFQYGKVPSLDALAQRGCCGFVSYRDDLQGVLLLLKLAGICTECTAT